MVCPRVEAEAGRGTHQAKLSRGKTGLAKSAESWEDRLLTVRSIPALPDVGAAFGRPSAFLVSGFSSSFATRRMCYGMQTLSHCPVASLEDRFLPDIKVAARML